MGRVSFCEGVNLRYSPEPNVGKIVVSEKRPGNCVGIPHRAFVASAKEDSAVYRRRHPGFLAVAFAMALGAVFGLRLNDVRGAESGDWIETWTASPQPIWTADFFAPLNIPRSLRYQTVRQIATITLGGTRVRIVLSNECGSEPLVIGAAHAAVAGQNGAIVAGSDRALTFGGQPSVTIPPGAPVISDPVELKVEPLSEVAVSVFFPEITPLTTFHWEGVQTAYISPEGNFVGDTEMKTDSTIKSRLFLSGILVDAPAGARAIVTFGDSITDGANSTPDANHRRGLTISAGLAVFWRHAKPSRPRTTSSKGTNNS